MIDIFDPTTWESAPHEFRIYGDNNAQVYAVVDEIDYHWAVRWLWNPTKPCKIARRKQYLRRAVNDYADGVRVRVETLYLHVEIMKRTGIQPLTSAHHIVDHRNGVGLDCRRSNLRWATASMNSKNIFGQYGHDIEELACP